MILIVFLNQLPASAQKVRHIKITEANARLYRDSLTLKIFGTQGLPYNIFPDSMITNVNSIDYFSGFPYTNIIFPNGNLDSIDKWQVSVDSSVANFPSKAKVYLFHPHNSNGKLFIYHSGHCAGVATSEDVFANSNGTDSGVVIPKLIAAGYTVLAVPMIHYRNTPATGYVCGYNKHDQLFSDSLYGYPLGLFFKPLIASLNQIGRGNFSAIYMCGLSGGGWTTSVYPALDSSISMSFPVAGSLPLPINFSIGDMEQYYPPVFNKLLDFHEIYTLGCLAPPRKMLQINNRYDPCCFSGAFEHVFYVDSVVKALEGSGGEYKYYLDETQSRHAISARAMQVIFKFIENDRAAILSLPLDTLYDGMNYNYSISENFTVQQLPISATLTYSLLKAPQWLTLNSTTGLLSGIVPSVNIVPLRDTISFKVEDSLGRFLIYNDILIKKRTLPYFFTMFSDSQTVYFLPFFSNSIQSINQLSKNYFYFNNPSLSIDELSILNNSIIKLKLNIPLTTTDSIGYNGMNELYPIKYTNGAKIENFGLTYINLSRVKTGFATAGMIRFNSETRKFEYFNGLTWVNMNQ